jgi:DNA-binding Xre family transcriptional regulator
MDYKEMIKLRALQLELHKQYGLASKQISKYVADGKPLNIQYEVLHKIKDFYRDSAAEIDKKF